MTAAAEKSDRAELISTVHKYIDLHPGIEPKYVWGRIYKMTGTVTRMNLFKIAKKKKLKIIDVLEKENLMADAVGIAKIILSGDENAPGR